MERTKDTDKNHLKASFWLCGKFMAEPVPSRKALFGF